MKVTIETIQRPPTKNAIGDLAYMGQALVKSKCICEKVTNKSQENQSYALRETNKSRGLPLDHISAVDPRHIQWICLAFQLCHPGG